MSPSCLRRLPLLFMVGIVCVVSAGAALAGCSSDNDCDPVFNEGQCRHQPTLWGMVDFPAEGNLCPSLTQFLDNNVLPTDIGLEGSEFLELTSQSEHSCCYTTRTYPCK